MLDVINPPKDSFTGARYNLLRVIVAYPQNAQNAQLSGRSTVVKQVLDEDHHPIATMKHTSLTVSLSFDETLSPILQSLDNSLTEAKQKEAEQKPCKNPSEKPRVRLKPSKRSQAKTQERIQQFLTFQHQNDLVVFCTM
jgi:hypothetical protein